MNADNNLVKSKKACGADWNGKMKCLRILGGMFWCLAGCWLNGQSVERVPNTTLSLPEQPPALGFRWEPAFPEIRSFSQPVALVAPPGEKGRLFVVERAGRIRVIPDLENPRRETFLSLTRNTESGSGEQGLLGLAFHPDYRRNGTFFVFYTAKGAGEPNRLSRFQADPENPNRALPDSEVILFSQRDDAGNHNGGDLHFGPDGYLYVSLGDEGNANDSLRNSQQIDRDFFAGILRIDVDKRAGNLEPNPHPAIETDENGAAHYSVPADNPYVGVEEFNGRRVRLAAVRTEFWAVGLRNPWRMAFDSATGALYTGDVGQGRREEVNWIVKGGNYGWNYREGTLAGPNRGVVPVGVQFEPPLLEYSHGNGGRQGKSITGGVVYRGSRWSPLFGAYVFADYVSGNVWLMRHDEKGRVLVWENIARETGISAFGTDPRNGDVLAADFNSNRLLRLVGEEAVEGIPLPETLSATGAFADLPSLTPNPGILPYSLNTPFWSDGAVKTRWFSVPDLSKQIRFSADGNWEFPSGTVWIKHFELERKAGDAASRRRLETRFIVQHDSGVYGMTYRWDDAQREAFLVPEEGMDEAFMIEENGVLREQVWRYPSRSECLSCHTKLGGGALGFSTAQLNRAHWHGDARENQILALAQAGYFAEPPDSVAGLPRSASAGDESQSLTHRVRSYLDANCSQCHQPGGTAIGLWDARLETAEPGLVPGPLANNSIYPARRLVVPGEPQSSELLRRISSSGSDRMPPLASNVLDREAIELLRRWIESLPPETFEDWRERYFGSSQEPAAAADGDFDQDRFSNRLEFQLGTNPLDSEDAWRLRVQRLGNQISIRFPRAEAGGWRFELQEASALHPNPDWRTVELGEPSPFWGRRGTEGEIRRPLSIGGASFFRAVIREE